MTRNEQIASIMLEAAELLKLDESAGANGAYVKFYKNRIKKAEAELKSLEKKHAAYKRAGYEDELENKELYARNKIDNSRQNLPKTNDEHKDMLHALKHGDLKRYYHKHRRESDEDRYGISEQLEEYSNARSDSKARGVKSNNRGKINGPLHDRINKRASLREAIDLFYDKAINADTIDEATEYINKAERLESLID